MEGEETTVRDQAMTLLSGPPCVLWQQWQRQWGLNDNLSSTTSSSLSMTQHDAAITHAYSKTFRTPVSSNCTKNNLSAYSNLPNINITVLLAVRFEQLKTPTSEPALISITASLVYITNVPHSKNISSYLIYLFSKAVVRIQIAMLGWALSPSLYPERMSSSQDPLR